MFKVVWVCGDPYLDLEGVCTIAIDYKEGRYIFYLNPYIKEDIEEERCFQSLIDWVDNEDQFFKDLNDWISCELKIS